MPAWQSLHQNSWLPNGGVACQNSEDIKRTSQQKLANGCQTHDVHAKVSMVLFQNPLDLTTEVIGGPKISGMKNDFLTKMLSQTLQRASRKGF